MKGSLLLAALMVPHVDGVRTRRRNPTATACLDWCEPDFYGGNNQGRHCAPGDMAHLCGSCSFCGGGGETCESQLGNIACDGDGCSTCGDRITWLKANLGMSETAARQRVADEFPSICGACGTGSPNPSPPAPTPPSPAPTPSSGGSCEEQLGNVACEGQFGNENCATCGERIQWLMANRGMSESAARQRVADEFVGVCGACGSGSPPVFEYEGYSQVWSDEFNYDGPVDPSEWYSVHSGGGFGNNEAQFYTNRTDNAWVSEGTLKIRARLENYGGHRFTSAKLQTRKDWLYGKFHMRTRLIGTARGTWAAHWMMPTESVYGIWPRSGEIDILEHVGYDTGRFHGTVHTQAYHHSIGTQIGGSTTADAWAWHTWTAEWRPDIILFGVNDVVYQVFRRESTTDKNKWPFDQKFYVILNHAVGGNWGGQQGIDDGAFAGEGQIFETDWVRVEQRL